MPEVSFTPIVGKYVAPANLESVASAYSTLEQGHQQAIATQSAVETELAKLDLNEAEDGWRQQQINRIRSSLNDNMRYGNAYTSLDNVVRDSGQIMSQPGMIGRLRAQQDYKAYLTQLNERTDLSEDYKNVFRQVNTYNYKDVLDANGNVIGGTKWQPKWKEVSEVPMSTILSNALKWAAQEQGGSTQTRWLDVNGKITTDPSQSVTGEYYDRTTNTWTRLTKDKLAAAVRTSIETTPGAKASIEQDYRIAKWKYDQNGGVNPDITDKSGLLLSPEEYLNKRIDPFYKSATYYNQKTDVEYGDALKAQLAYNAKHKSGLDGISPNRAIDALGIITNPIQIDNTAPIEEQGNLNIANQNIANLLLKNNPNANINLDGMTDKQIMDAINAISNPQDKAEAIIQMQIRRDANDYLKHIKEDMGENDKLKFEANVAINSGTKLKQGKNHYYDEYIGHTNLIWSDAKYIRTYFADNALVNRFMDAVGGEDKARSLGITSGTNNGKSYVQLDYDNRIYTGIFGNAVRDAINSQKFGPELIRSVRGTFNWLTNDNGGDGVVRVNNNGNETSLTVEDTKPISRSSDRVGLPNLSTQGDGVFARIGDYTNSLNKDYDRALKSLGKLTIESQAIRAATPDVAESLFMLKQNPTTENERIYKLNEREAKEALQSLDLVQSGAYKVDDNNNFSRISTEERKIIQGKMRSAKAEISNPNLVQNPKTGRWGPSFNVTYKDGDDYKTVSVYVPDGLNSATFEKWNRDTNLRAKNRISRYFAEERDIPIVSGRPFAGLGNIYVRHRNGVTSLIDKDVNKNVGNITTADAVNLKDISYQWEDTYNFVRAGIQSVNHPSTVAMINKVAIALASLSGNDDEGTIDYYRSKLIENLTK